MSRRRKGYWKTIAQSLSYELIDHKGKCVAKLFRRRMWSEELRCYDKIFWEFIFTLSDETIITISIPDCWPGLAKMNRKFDEILYYYSWQYNNDSISIHARNVLKAFLVANN